MLYIRLSLTASKQKQTKLRGKRSPPRISALRHTDVPMRKPRISYYFILCASISNVPAMCFFVYKPHLSRSYIQHLKSIHPSHFDSFFGRMQLPRPLASMKVPVIYFQYVLLSRAKNTRAAKLLVVYFSALSIKRLQRIGRITLWGSWLTSAPYWRYRHQSIKACLPIC